MSRTPASPAQLPRGLDGEQAERLLDAAGDISLVLDGDGQVLEVRAQDPALQKAVRRAWQGKAWTDIVTVESRDKVAALLRDALDSGVSAPRQVNHARQGGPDLPVLYTAARVAGGGRSRSADRVVAVGRDLRDTMALQRRLVEAQQTMERDYWRFREAETRYRNLFQASGEAVLIADGTHLRILEANPAAQALVAGARAKTAKLVGSALPSLFAPEAAEPLAAALAAARSVGKHERLAATLALSGQAVAVAVTSFRQDQASFLLVRLAPQGSEARRARGNGRAAPDALTAGGFGADSIEAAFVRSAADALAFTDGSGRVISVNRAFARLAQLSSEDQARGEPLDRWLGRTGVELPVLLANLREGGSAGLFVTELRGALGVVTEVEIAASALDGGGAAVFAFSLRDIGRRLAPSEQALPKVPTSVKQLTELVGRVPLKQIVAETSDLIERLSIETALQMTRDNRALAAQLLGLSRQSLYVKLRRFGLGDLPPGDEG
jgi:transcriptional regulator PpsR